MENEWNDDDYCLVIYPALDDYLKDRVWTPRKIAKRVTRSLGEVDDDKPLFSSNERKVRFGKPSLAELQARKRP